MLVLASVIRNTKVIALIFFGFCLGSAVLGQNEALTNESIIEMVKQKLPDTVIISKVKVSKVSFRTEIGDLKTLTENGVPEAVISAMIEKSAEKPKSDKEVQYSDQNAEFGNISEISEKTRIFLKINDVKSREIITKEISKHHFLVLTDNPKDCDYAIRFVIGSVDKGSNALLNTEHNIVVTGRMQVYKYLPIEAGAEKGRIRIIWQKDKQQDWSGGLTLDKHPANVIKDFLKELNRSKKSKNN